jgi:hypothetical protein
MAPTKRFFRIAANRRASARNITASRRRGRLPLILVFEFC